MLPAGAFSEHVVPPQDTDPAIDVYLEPHYAYLDTRDQAPRRKLLVFLAGSDEIPEQTVGMLQEGARLGYHAVGLRYANDFDVYGVCGDDPDCYGLLRHEELDGGDHTPVVDVGLENGIEHRLIALLAYLDAKAPEEGWCRWVDGVVPLWSQIVIAGRSHGATTAGLIGTVREVDRVVMFTGPADHVADDVPATWILGESVTPRDRFFGFAGGSDRLYALLLANWDALGLSGAPVDVDATAPPYSESHRLVSVSGDATSIVSDAKHRAAWAYLYQ